MIRGKIFHNKPKNCVFGPWTHKYTHSTFRSRVLYSWHEDVKKNPHTHACTHAHFLRVICFLMGFSKSSQTCGVEHRAEMNSDIYKVSVSSSFQMYFSSHRPSVMVLELQAKVIALNEIEMWADHLKQNSTRTSMLSTTKTTQIVLEKVTHSFQLPIIKPLLPVIQLCCFIQTLFHFNDFMIVTHLPSLALLGWSPNNLTGGDWRQEYLLLTSSKERSRPLQMATSLSKYKIRQWDLEHSMPVNCPSGSHERFHSSHSNLITRGKISNFSCCCNKPHQKHKSQVAEGDR